MSISATFSLLKGQISAFRVAAQIETITQHIEVDLMSMVLVWSSAHSAFKNPFKDLVSDH